MLGGIVKIYPAHLFDDVALTLIFSHALESASS